jgi:hypothetical protein
VGLGGESATPKGQNSSKKIWGFAHVDGRTTPMGHRSGSATPMALALGGDSATPKEQNPSIFYLFFVIPWGGSATPNLPKGWLVLFLFSFFFFKKNCYYYYFLKILYIYIVPRVNLSSWHVGSH